MRVYVDLDSLLPVISPANSRPVTRLTFVRGAATPIEIQFLRDGEPELLEDGAAIRFLLKPAGEFDGDALVFADDFTTPETSAGYYTASPSFNTEELNAAMLSPDGDPDNDVAILQCGGSIAWSVGEDEPTKTLPWEANVKNSYDNGSEGAPTSAVAVSDLTNLERLSLASPRVGKLVRVSDQGDRLEMFVGGSGSGLFIVGHGASSTFIRSGSLNGKPRFVWAEQSSEYFSEWSGTEWRIEGNGDGLLWSSPEDVATPDLVVTWTKIVELAYPAQPTVTAAPAANDANWAVLKPTVLLTVTATSFSADPVPTPTINGVALIEDTPVEIGWVDPLSITYDEPVIDETATIGSTASIGGNDWGNIPSIDPVNGEPFALPVAGLIPDRGSVGITITVNAAP